MNSTRLVSKHFRTEFETFGLNIESFDDPLSFLLRAGYTGVELPVPSVEKLEIELCYPLLENCRFLKVKSSFAFSLFMCRLFDLDGNAGG
jgi:hypothetical protein